MNILQRAVSAFTKRSYPSPQPVTWESVFGPNRYSLSGVSVNENSMLDHSPVWAGVSILARDIAKLPLVLYKNLPNGGKEPFKNHPLYRILHDEWNPEMTSYKARETMFALCILYRNAYAEIVRNEAGQIAGLYPIVPTRVTPFREANSGRLMYRVSNPNGGQTILSPANIIHFSGLSLDGVIGETLAGHAEESVSLGLAAEKFGAAFFGNGATFGGVVSYPNALNPETRNTVREQIEAVHAGVERAHKILVLAAGAKFDQRGTAPDNAQYIETRKFQINEVSRWLTMPPHKLGDLENAHFTNIEEQEIQYYVGTVSGWLKMAEQELQRKCIRPLEYAQQTIEHRMEGVLRGNSTQRADYYAKMHAIGVFSINDILRLENMNPIGEAGNMHLVPLNMVPIEKYPEMIDAKIEADKAKIQAQKQIDAPKPEPEPSKDDDAAVNALREAVREATERAEQHAARAAEAATEAATSKDHVEEWRTIAEQEKIAATAARDEADRHAVALAAVTVERDAAVAQREQEAALRADAERRAQEAEAAKVAAEHAALEQADNARRAAEQVAAALAQKEDAEVRGLSSQQETVSVRAAVEAAQAELDSRNAALAEAQRALDAATQDAAAAQAKARELEADIAARREAEVARLTNVLAAHRALVVDAVGRFLRPEITRARRNHPDFKVWMEAFYDIHQRAVAEALLPVANAILAWRGSSESAEALSEQMAAEHCAESKRQMQAALDASEHKDEFRATLDAMLTRWETERPQRLADKVLNDEVHYIRSYR